MKKGIHLNYKKTKLVMTDGSTINVLSTNHNSVVRLNIDSKAHQL